MFRFSERRSLPTMVQEAVELDLISNGLLSGPGHHTVIDGIDRSSGRPADVVIIASRIKIVLYMWY